MSSQEIVRPIGRQEEKVEQQRQKWLQGKQVFEEEERHQGQGQQEQERQERKEGEENEKRAQDQTLQEEQRR